MDKLTDLAKRLRPFITSIAYSVVSQTLNNRITLYHQSGSLKVFEANSAGLTAALTAAAYGDVVFVPAGSIAGDFDVPGGVRVQGFGGNTTLAGQVRLGAGSELCLVAVVNAGAGERVAVVGPESGTAYIRDCNLVGNSTDGAGYALACRGGNLHAIGCGLSGTGATEGYVVKMGGNGDTYLLHCQITSSTGLVSGSGPVYYPGGRYYSDEGMILDQTNTWLGTEPPYEADMFSGHTDTNRAWLVNWNRQSDVYFDLGFVATAGTLYARVRHYTQIPEAWPATDAAVFQRYASVDGITWTPIGSGMGWPAQTQYPGDFIDFEIMPVAGYRYIRLYTWSGGRSGLEFAAFFLTDHVIAGSVYVQGCSGDTAGGIPLAGDRAVYDAAGYPTLHANDTDTSAASLHHTLGSGSNQAAAGDHAHGARTENVLVAQGASGPALKDSHLKDQITGSYLASVAAALTGNRTYTLRDADMTLAALNLAQVWSAAQEIRVDGEQLRLSYSASVYSTIQTLSDGTLEVRTPSSRTIRYVKDNAMTTLAFRSFGTTGTVPAIVSQRARGTEASPTAVLNNDQLFSFGGEGYDGNAWTEANNAVIQFLAAENFTTTAKGTQIQFATTPLGSTTRTTRVVIDAAGHLGVGYTNTSGMAARVDIKGSADEVQLRVLANGTQTTNLQEWQTSGGAVLGAIGPGGEWKPPSMADTSAPNNSVYYSTTAGKLVYKDAGGTVNALY